MNQMKLIFKLTLISIACTGCAKIAPGMYVDAHGKRPQGLVAPHGDCIPIIEITPEFICESDFQFCTADNYNQFSMPSRYQYRVGTADRLSIIVWGQPELNNPTNATTFFEQIGFIVNEEGQIYYPYVGKIDVGGKTVDEIRDAVSEKLSVIVKNPALSVTVLDYRSQFVNVIGEVNLPTTVPICDVPLTPVDAISKAGGATFQGDLQGIMVKRGEQTYTFNVLPRTYGGKNAPCLMHGDLVYVPSKVNNQVYVLGEFRFPQSLVMDSDVLTLADAIARASGVDPVASNPQQLFVFRQDASGERVAYHLDARSPTALLLANQFPLQRQDIIYVGTYQPAILNRIMTNFLSTTKAAADLSWSASNISDVINRYNSNTINNKSAVTNELND